MKTTDILDALNAVDEETLAATEEFFAEKEGAKKVKVRKTVRILLVAAALALLLGATAYAAGLFGMSGRVTEPEETFPVHFIVEGGDEINGNWKGTYALEFEGPETCQPVRYRLGWLPEGLKGTPLGENGEVERRDWDGDTMYIPWAEHTELGTGDGVHYLTTDMYYAPQFVNGGALILMDTVPDTVEEETWDGLALVKITSKGWRRASSGEFIPWGDADRSFVTVYHPEEGWIFCVRGTLSMEDLVKIAKNIEVEQTEGLVEQSQFQNPYEFFDAARG